MIYAENILICIVAPLLISLFFIHGSARRFTVSFLIGMAVCLLAAYISGFINVVSGMSAEDTAIFISPIVEELMKYLPILFFLFMFMPENKTLMIIAVGICTGFATFENCCYILSSGASSLPYVLIRGMAVGVMHVVSGLGVTFGLVLSRRYNMLTLAGFVGALGISTIFHALYNLLVSEPGITTAFGYALPLMTAAILSLPYKRLIETESKIEE